MPNSTRGRADSPLRSTDYGLEPYQHGLALIREDFSAVSLREYLPHEGFELSLFLDIAQQLIEAINIIHQHNIIHKDIKPSNILINPETKQVKIIDFGIASQWGQETQQVITPDKLEGTLAYISPEQTGRMNRPVDYRTDFYSLGATLYELVTGLKIGRLLQQNQSEADSQAAMFEIVGHLNLGQTLLTNPAERIALATLNLNAGQRAKNSVAYHLARDYLATGLALLGPDSWTSHPDLTLALHREQAEAEYLSGHYEAVEQLVQSAAANLDSAVEKVTMYNVLIAMYTIQAQYETTLALGRDMLTLLGIELPTWETLDAAIGAEIGKMHSLLQGVVVSDLIDHPVITAPEHIVRQRHQIYH